jgi:hypothetical protein
MPLFFGLKRPIEATADITVLTGTVAYLTYIWSGVDTVAAWCIAPYLGWLSFATYLSVSFERGEFTPDGNMADQINYRPALGILMTGTSPTRKPKYLHQIGAQELTPSM